MSKVIIIFNIQGLNVAFYYVALTFNLVEINCEPFSLEQMLVTKLEERKFYNT